MRLYCRTLLAAFVLVMAFNAAPLLAAGKETGVKAAASSPLAVFPDTRYEFEPVMEGTKITHDFIIENHGDAPLVIMSVRPD